MVSLHSVIEAVKTASHWAHLTAGATKHTDLTLVGVAELGYAVYPWAVIIYIVAALMGQLIKLLK